MTSLKQICRLACGVQHYAWGERLHAGQVPYIAELLAVPPQPGTPYAELWIGAHPDMPSRLQESGTAMPLQELIAAHPQEILGPQVLDAGFTTLPFLLKVLSCEAPLSIQAHPDPDLAAQLHRSDPTHYPDSNHKPEIAIALTDFEALCQFRCETAIRADLQRLPMLADLAAAAASAAAAVWLRSVYAELFHLPDTAVVSLLEALQRHLCSAPSHTPEDTCFLRLAAAYPGDRGALCAYLLNLVHLRPGQGIFLAANEPHAYLRGSIIECMANSNNVVRGGLTDKFIDRNILLHMLTYRCGSPQILGGDTAPGSTTHYTPPAPDFRVSLTRGPLCVRLNDALPALPRLLLVLRGQATFTTAEGHALRAPRGSAWLLPAAATTSVRLQHPEDLLVSATANLPGPKPPHPAPIR